LDSSNKNLSRIPPSLLPEAQNGKELLYTPSMEGSEHPGSIVVLDFGGQYAHLIARRVREFGAYSAILPPETDAQDLKDAAGIILSGGPQSVYDEGSPQADPAMLNLGIPVLGLCYGLHWMTQALGGEVTPGKVKEYGSTELTTSSHTSTLFQDVPQHFTAWMSHGDEALKLPDGFVPTASSEDCRFAAFEDPARKLFALQFHPEVVHTEHGDDILKRFVGLCDATPWSVTGYRDRVSNEVREVVGDRKVFLLVSGGVDSTVAFVLLNDVLGSERVQGLVVDTGLMRKNEIQEVEDAFTKLGITNLRVEEASEEFFRALDGVVGPEDKRRVIGDTFLAVQKRVSEQMHLSIEDGWMLGQGTIYPDTIETGGTKHADQIKTHHNRVEAIQRMINRGLVIEPLKDLYKDEVRKLGEELGLPHELLWRHPFPGPGLGVRILCAKEPEPTPPLPSGVSAALVLPVRSVGVQGDARTYRHALVLFSEDPTSITQQQWKHATEIPNRAKDFNRVLVCTSHALESTDAPPVTLVFTPGGMTRERADLLREADTIVDQEVRSANLYDEIWQFPVVLLPVGVRPGGQSIVLRPFSSQEVMTARAYELPRDVLERITTRLTALPGIDLVFYDLTHKPPGTIEWE
jgi:GMP synthase (glutamine-hydrolysing)